MSLDMATLMQEREEKLNAALRRLTQTQEAVISQQLVEDSIEFVDIPDECMA